MSDTSHVTDLPDIDSRYLLKNSEVLPKGLTLPMEEENTWRVQGMLFLDPSSMLK